MAGPLASPIVDLLLDEIIASLRDVSHGQSLGEMLAELGIEDFATTRATEMIGGREPTFDDGKSTPPSNENEGAAIQVTTDHGICLPAAELVTGLNGTRTLGDMAFFGPDAARVGGTLTLSPES